MVDKNKILFYGVGDVGVNRENPESIFAKTVTILNQADIVFCQSEKAFSGRGSLVTERDHTRTDPKMVAALKFAGFDVVSFASNMAMDWGSDALSDTIDVLRQNGMTVIGVGRDISEARTPAVFERKGTRIAFLAYCSVAPPGYEATANKPGLAPMRAWTLYHQIDKQPGTPPKILTFADHDDLEAMKEDIKRVRPLVDVVVVSMHWGLHFAPAIILQYQREVGHAAIDAGADLILGHHAHILKGIEVYKGKVIFYSLCNFAMDFPYQARLERLQKSPGFKERAELYNLKFDPNYPGYAFPIDSRKTIIAKCVISDKKIEKVSFLPAFIDERAEPRVLLPDDEEFSDVVTYMKDITAHQGIDTTFSVEGSEVVILV